jgi:hypothetical protein
MGLVIASLALMIVADGSEVGAAHQVESAAASRSWVILPPEEAEHFIHPCSRPVPAGLSGTWTPSPADIAPVEAALPREIARSMAKIRRDLRRMDPPRYYRQYGGVLLGGQRLIYVIGVSKAMVDRRPFAFRAWRNEILRLCDFGRDAFGALFDPTVAAFTSFEFDL